MARITTDVPYLKLTRNGVYQPRWEPGPKLRAHGAHGQPLKDDAGAWLPLDAAIAKARELNAKAAALMDDGKRLKLGPPKRHPRCCEALWHLYTKSPKWQQLAPKTRSGYENHAQIFLAEFGAEPVAALAKSHLHTWWEELYHARGHAMANATLAVVRLLLSYAVKKDWRTTNPARELGLETVPPRVAVWPARLCEAFVAKADALGLAPIGDAVMIALHTGQRLNDVVELAEDRLVDGKARFLQGKTGARVTVPLTGALQARIATIHERRARRPGVMQLALAKRLVLCHDAAEYSLKHFNTHFRQVRDAVVADEMRRLRETQPGSKEPPEAAALQFRDLRDTAITRLALAGCTIPEIRSITGHTVESIHTVLKHYLALDEAMADRAIERLQAWMAEQGIAV